MSAVTAERTPRPRHRFPVMRNVAGQTRGDAEQSSLVHAARRFHRVSSWLVSAVCHLAVVLLLVLMVVPQRSSGTSTLLVALDAGVEEPQPRFVVPVQSTLDAPAEQSPEPVAAPDVEAMVRDGSVAVALDPLGVGDAVMPPSAAALDTPVGSRRNRPGEAMFFGTSASGRDFVFILDCSGSMIARSGGRFARAREELVESISRLQPDQRFYVFLFNWSTAPMFGPADDPGTLVHATPENVDRLRRWLAGIYPQSGTDPRRALREAFRMRPDAIFLLSDGQFNTPSEYNAMLGWDTSRTTVFDVVARSNSADTQIHTIAFEDVIAAQGMSLLAERTNGQFRFVPAPGQEDIAAVPERR